MASNPRGRKKKSDQSVSTLLAALKFVSMALTDSKADPQFTHVTLRRNLATLYNPVFAVGHPIQDDIDASPHLQRLIDALSKCGQTLSITTLGGTGPREESPVKLSIKSDKFKALVPCLELHMPHTTPDTPCAAIDDRLRAGFEALAAIPSATAQRPFAKGLLLQAGSMVACDGFSLAEYWHGIDLPPGLLIPAQVVDVIVKAKKPLKSFGFRPDSSATFYFDDDSWVKTQLLVESYPDYQRILAAPSNPWPLPEGFYTALKSVASFNDSGQVFFNAGLLSSHPTNDEGATYEIEGLPDNKAYNAKFLLMFEGLADRFDFTSYDNCMFFGENLRGAIAAIRR